MPAPNRKVLDEWINNYIKLGWDTVPLSELITNKDTGKTSFLPLIKWRTEESINLDLYKNIAIKPMGNLIVFDLDVKCAGATEYYNFLLEEYGELPETAYSKTKSGGYHFYYKGSCPTFHDPRGIDINSEGSLLFEAPSDGYSWVLSPTDTPIADCPEWVINYFCKRKETIDVINVEKSTYNREEIIKILYCIDPNLIVYDNWYRIGTILRDVGIEFQIWNDWSSGGCKYTNINDTAKKWNQLPKIDNHQKPLTIATLIHYAQDPKLYIKEYILEHNLDHEISLCYKPEARITVNFPQYHDCKFSEFVNFIYKKEPFFDDNISTSLAISMISHAAIGNYISFTNLPVGVNNIFYAGAASGKGKIIDYCNYFFKQFKKEIVMSECGSAQAFHDCFAKNNYRTFILDEGLQFILSCINNDFKKDIITKLLKICQASPTLEGYVTMSKIYPEVIFPQLNLVFTGTINQLKKIYSNPELNNGGFLSRLFPVTNLTSCFDELSFNEPELSTEIINNIKQIHWNYQGIEHTIALLPSASVGEKPKNKVPIEPDAMILYRKLVEEKRKSLRDTEAELLLDDDNAQSIISRYSEHLSKIASLIAIYNNKPVTVNDIIFADKYININIDKTLEIFYKKTPSNLTEAITEKIITLIETKPLQLSKNDIVRKFNPGKRNTISKIIDELLKNKFISEKIIYIRGKEKIVFKLEN